MAAADIALQARARRAYEMGRVLLGLRRAAVVVPMAALSLFACGRPAATAFTAAVLGLLVLALEWHGRGLGRGSRIGLLAGTPPLLVPLVVRATLHVCGTTLCASFSAVCFAAGVLGGALLGGWAIRRGLQPRDIAAAGVVAGLTGALGCLVAGVGGLVGLFVGLALGAAPVLALRRV